MPEGLNFLEKVFYTIFGITTSQATPTIVTVSPPPAPYISSQVVGTGQGSIISRVITRDITAEAIIINEPAQGYSPTP